MGFLFLFDLLDVEKVGVCGVFWDMGGLGERREVGLKIMLLEGRPNQVVIKSGTLTYI